MTAIAWDGTTLPINIEGVNRGGVKFTSKNLAQHSKTKPPQ